MIDNFASLIHQDLWKYSGAAFYSGRIAFNTSSPLYILGENPGGSPKGQANETVEWHTKWVLNEAEADWSAYQEPWRDKSPGGTVGLQPRVLHLLGHLHLKAGNVPASNVIFVRSARENDITNQFQRLAELCWPFHRAVIERLGVRVVLCLGKKSGGWVCEQLNANIKVCEFVEQYKKRHWKSISYKNSDGVAVVVATHPSRADWTKLEADPSKLVKRMLEITT